MSRLINADKLTFSNLLGDDGYSHTVVYETDIENAREIHPNCRNCEYYASYEGVCCNPDSEWVAEFRDSDNICGEWESKE